MVSSKSTLILAAVATVTTLFACGGSSKPVAQATPPSGDDVPTTTAAAPTTSAAPTPPPPVPTGGTVLIGDINAPKGFNPRPALTLLTSQLLDCYNKARVINPDLHGKVTLRIQIAESGAVTSVDAAPGGHANDAGLISCANDVMKVSGQFPKPGGSATVLAPLVFRP